MSKLRLSNKYGTWEMNILKFNSPIASQISTVQVHKMSHHFPIRANQAQIQFSAIFVSEEEFENFQRYVRRHQQQVLADPSSLMTLNWPERNINNWTGVIKRFQAGGARFNFAPKADFVIDLVDSMMAQRTDLYTDGLLWRTIYGLGMGPDSVLSPPSESDLQHQRDLFGEDVNGTVATPSPSINPSIPGIGPGGIGAGV